MRISSFCALALSVSVGTALLGCGGSQPPIGAPSLLPKSSESLETLKRSAVMPTYKVSVPLIYAVASGPGGWVSVYDANENNPKPIATITKGLDAPETDCIDGDGTLYVTNKPGSAGWVSEYALGQTKPLRVITKGINSPSFCAIDASGNLWVTNIGLDDVAEYLKGSTKPHATITKGLTYADGIAIDPAGNMYVGNLVPYGKSGNESNIQVYAPGSKTPSRTITDGVTWPVGIAVDAHDTLYVTNFNKPCNIEEYRVGQSKPYRTIAKQNYCSPVAVVGKNGWLYVGDWPYSLNSNPYVILEYPPHSLKPSSKELMQDISVPIGLAYYPPLLP
jgi:hypothetical protein